MVSPQHKVAIPSRNKKRKAGRPAKQRKISPKKRRNSVSDISDDSKDEDDLDEEPWDGDGESEDEYEVEKILEMRAKKNGSREFLVHWKKWSSEHDTWEPEANLKCQEIIDRFLNNVEDEKDTNIKESRVGRKQSERVTSAARSARRQSKRNNKQNVSYIDGEEDEDEGEASDGEVSDSKAVVDESDAIDVKVGDDK